MYLRLLHRKRTSGQFFGFSYPSSLQKDSKQLQPEDLTDVICIRTNTKEMYA